METVAVIIPTLNEERSIGKVIDGVPVAALLKDGIETALYVIDGHSTDNTREIAAEKGAQIILEARLGKGSAIQTAFKSITAYYAIMIDVDGTYPIEMATEMARMLKTHDVVCLEQACHLSRHFNRVRIVPVNHNRVVGTDGLKCRLNCRSLSFTLFEYELGALFDGELPRVIGGLPVDHVHSSFKAILQQIGNGHVVDDLAD